MEYSNGGRPAPRRDRGFYADSLAAVFPDPTGKANSRIASEGAAVWFCLSFARAAISCVAGRSLAGRCAMLCQADGLAFPVLIRLPVEVDGKPNLMGLPWRPEPPPRIAPVYPRGACREMAAAPPLALGIEAEWRKRAMGVVPAQPKARPEGQRPSLPFLLPY
ncbi:hypothetical protein [Hyphomonas pacifica]|uniref:Uncharacterized protein n=1 Tax=Hyphomonas pacifica TaxID=1280941 RepID=A0A062U159_9PROT|nr:hypothetical protein [Hyphomonas pacifica]KCZ50364.1 hypothetical protein HY2_14150 [Hyphomonas pacifica]RAN32656.1 hypothetical protein HY3_14630 [Hyphomonas pacifica]